MIDEGGNTGVGEASTIQNLSLDDPKKIESFLDDLCSSPFEENVLTQCPPYLPALQFGLETALLDLKNSKSQGILFDSDFTNGSAGIIINGLIWMGEKEFMFQQIKQKIQQGYQCIKMKIGAIAFDEELALIKYIRSQFSSSDIELRVDANGAFDPQSALDKLRQLAEFNLHSIEQPIKQGQLDDMAKLCLKTPLPIALDEELIGITSAEEKQFLLSTIKPQYIILKPSLVGGIKASEEWISIAEKQNINWWATSALESNIGLNAISQWVFTKQNPMPQGLGTGQLFVNNINSPLYLKGEQLYYDPNKPWQQVGLGI